MRDGYSERRAPFVRDPAQMKALAAYVAAGGSVSGAARRVGSQPNTVKRHLDDRRARSGLTTEQLICWVGIGGRARRTEVGPGSYSRADMRADPWLVGRSRRRRTRRRAPLGSSVALALAAAITSACGARIAMSAPPVASPAGSAAGPSQATPSPSREASAEPAGQLRAVGLMTVPRAVATATRLLDGRVLVAGGCSDAGCDLGSRGGFTAELYDPVAGTFSPTGSLATPRYKGGAIPLADGRILVFGGSGDIDGTITYASSEVYDPAAGSFSPGPSMRFPRYKVADSTIALDGGRFLVAAGAPAPEVFDLATVTFRPIAGSLGATRLFLASAALDGSRALLVGGYDRVIRPTDQAWIFDAGT
jgi:hypothetical protein